MFADAPSIHSKTLSNCCVPGAVHPWTSPPGTDSVRQLLWSPLFRLPSYTQSAVVWKHHMESSTHFEARPRSHNFCSGMLLWLFCHCCWSLTAPNVLVWRCACIGKNTAHVGSGTPHGSRDPLGVLKCITTNKGEHVHTVFLRSHTMDPGTGRGLPGAPSNALACLSEAKDSATSSWTCLLGPGDCQRLCET